MAGGGGAGAGSRLQLQLQFRLSVAVTAAVAVARIWPASWLGISTGIRLSQIELCAKICRRVNCTPTKRKVSQLVLN